jgi:hypothetical protein
MGAEEIVAVLASLPFQSVKHVGEFANRRLLFGTLLISTDSPSTFYSNETIFVILNYYCYYVCCCCLLFVVACFVCSEIGRRAADGWRWHCCVCQRRSLCTYLFTHFFSIVYISYFFLIHKIIIFIPLYASSSISNGRSLINLSFTD